jgi:hypothetical protein
MKTRDKIIIAISVIGFAELCHYWKLSRRYNHFNRFRRTDVQPEQTREMLDAVLAKNPDFFERTQMFEHTSHIKNKNDLYDCVRIQSDLRPANKLQVGCARIYWRYHPFAFEIAMKLIRQIGNMYMRHYLGFTRKWHKTTDGLYSVWTYDVPGTKPLIFFPGFGLGAIPYAKYAKKFERTVHVIEVPNIGYATPYSDRHATSNTIYEVVSIYGNANDVFAHSLGGVHAAMWMNEITVREGTSLPEHNIVICDGFVNPVDILRSHMYPFVNFCDYRNMYKKPKTKLEFNIFVWIAAHNLEFGSWAKRYHNWYDGTMWRDYPNANIKYIYSENDILYDTRYIADNCHDSLCIGNGGHGSVIFGKKRDYVFSLVKQWLD